MLSKTRLHGRFDIMTATQRFEVKMTGEGSIALSSSLLQHLTKGLGVERASEECMNSARVVRGMEGSALLGETVAWLFVNRPSQCEVTISGPGLADSFTIRPPCVPMEVANPNPNPNLNPNPNWMEVANRASPIGEGILPHETIEVYHLHCHFDASTEPAALLFLEETRQKIEEDGGSVLHSHIWHKKNGPHIGWSWELWVDTTEALGSGVLHFMTSRPPALRLCLHADTDQEYTDHGARLGFVGPLDPLDLLFFSPPAPEAYNGPSGPRQSTRDRVYSMGEFWDLAALKKGAYGAQQRTIETATTAAFVTSEATKSVPTTMPSLFLPHGSPPVPIERCASETWLQGAASSLPSKPKAIIFMSPHYMRKAFTVSLCERPATIYDFDDDTDPEKLKILESLTYACPGDKHLARRAANLIRGAGLECEENETRGMDHGVWTPLYVMYPEADVPVISLSVSKSLSAAEHIAVGRALAPLAEEGILLLGSGEVVHNVPLMGPRGSPQSEWCLAFEGWLEALLASPPSAARDAAFAEYRKAPGAEMSHPIKQAWPPERNLTKPFESPGEHLMPWFFAYGAAGPQASGRCVHKEYLGSLPMAAYEFRPPPHAQRAKL